MNPAWLVAVARSASTWALSVAPSSRYSWAGVIHNKLLRWSLFVAADAAWLAGISNMTPMQRAITAKLLLPSIASFLRFTAIKFCPQVCPRPRRNSSGVQMIGRQGHRLTFHPADASGAKIGSIQQRQPLLSRRRNQRRTRHDRMPCRMKSWTR